MTVASAEASPQSRNHLLDRLPTDEYAVLRPALETVRLPAKRRLAEPGAPMDAVYFPLGGVISLSATDEHGGVVEVGSIGCEGMAGLPVLLGSDRSAGLLHVQMGGEAERMEAGTFRREVERHPVFRRLLMLYTEAFLAQLAQSTACNRLHSAECRLARWLLICRDRLSRDDLPITHESLAHMLGVRRATVTETAGDLQRRGLIRYRRGVVTIVHRDRLEAASCECYRIVREEFDRLLGVRVG